MAGIDIHIALKNIADITKTPELAKTCRELQNSELKDIISKLSEYILKVEDALLFKQHLSNILLALVSLKIPLKPVFSNPEYETCSDSEKVSYLEYSIVLGLLSDHPDVLQYALKYFDINKVPPFEVFIHLEDSHSVAKKRRLLDSMQKMTDELIVACCYKLLSKLPNELSTKWDWTQFVSNYYTHDNVVIRWKVKECMVILSNMTETQSRKLSDFFTITDEESLQCEIIAQKKAIVYPVNDCMKDVELNVDSVVNIDGILLPIYNKNNTQAGNLVPVKSTKNNLRSLALAVASGQGLCLMGPVGSGKTSLVEHLAAITGRKGVAFKKVQLGDQTDSRMLLGSHTCTDIPGEFIWRPGVLTEAVQNGHWLLLEDIDCAALDVASTLNSLLEMNTLCVPGYRDSLPVTPGFQLFVTQRTLITNYGFQKKMSSSSALLQKHLTQINVEPLSRSELSEVVQTLYPSLSTICSRMIEVFMMFSVGSHDTSLQNTDVVTDKETSVNVLRGSRLISTRDLMKWCARAVVGLDVTSPDSALKVLQDALDIFTCSVSSPEHRLELAKKVGTCLGIVETKSEFYCKHYKPNVSLHPAYLEVGRAKVPRVEKSLQSIDFDAKQVVFSFTRQSTCLLERIACCVTSNEPVLLVGETGTGKTSSVQYLARQTGHKLVVINMNQQSDSADLLGGYKPVDMKFVIYPIKNEFEELFRGFYNVEKNKKFLGHIETCYDTENWSALLALMKQSYEAALRRLKAEKKKMLKTWSKFGHKLTKLEQQVKAASKLTFAFIEGSLVKAMQEGHWVLLDEINLASAEILECLAGLLEDKNESIDLLEKGDKVPIKRHPDFTLFACMNPATDVGKKDLPVGLRNRFTEFFIDELLERNDLMLLIGDYLYHMNLSGAALEAIYSFYTNVRKAAKLNLVDGAGNSPHYSLRTLCRALTAAAKAKCGTVARSLYESFCLSFLTQLDSSSHPVVEAMIAQAVIGKKNIKTVTSQAIPEPQVLGQKFLLFEGHWIPQGKIDVDIPKDYILTSTVRKNLRDIARIISLGRLPVLLQGDTSVGKTSLITYIAKASGNYCVRINNHEHTDLQEYIGSYAADANGKLVFKEGVLVEAMRRGYWIILDELNLAPSDVLEALNRVLDDNRELFIPETQQVVKADPNFMLFATQNPPGLYGGRKMLSRAFRNRFVELHFDEIPRKELEIILHQRCHVPPAYSKKMIAVMADLQLRRRGSAAVQGKDGFITLRDLFRWGQRYNYACKEALTDDTFYDWDQHIADEGYLILAGKVRQPDERNIIVEILQKNIKRNVNPDNLFNLHAATSPVTKTILETILNNKLDEFSHIVWTYNMRRLAVLIAKAFNFKEPVLLVGETGCGKTTICQVFAALKKRQLLSVNCHMHTESSDFLGGLRPVRQYQNDGRLFEWVDGPLVKAMESGAIFMADEISLADDSVLERLNSLLEPERQLVLSERGMEENSDIVVIVANENFHFIGTMNPGGDFGKKELSPALRNRFTEIWCDSVTSREDLQNVLERSVNKGISMGNQEDGSSGIGTRILDFVEWLKGSDATSKFPFSIRDLLSWVHFINITVSKKILDVPEAYVHGACMTFLDCFGTALTGHIDSEVLISLRKTAIEFLLNQIKTVGNEYIDDLRDILNNKPEKLIPNGTPEKFGVEPFFINIGQYIDKDRNCMSQFSFSPVTTTANTLRVLRGMQLNKAILLEGNPGVGKTSLVLALAEYCNHKVVRINFSDQTDITDLFGTDLPAEDGSFVFKEGEFLNALQNGDWIILDELNLAPQPVLEGLNACLDHRGEVFVPELGKTFKINPETKFFACQNPLNQGGARRGLPISFLNRFTQVYVDSLTPYDILFIVTAHYPEISHDILDRIVKFNSILALEIVEQKLWAHSGSPWEMNLRDVRRWCDAMLNDILIEGNKPTPGSYVDMLYVNRMRTIEDKERMIKTYNDVFEPLYPRSDSAPQFFIYSKEIEIGDVILDRNYEKYFKNRRALQSNLVILRNQMPTLKTLLQCIKMEWLTILVGPSATGKSSIIQALADLTGNNLHVIPVTSAMDVSDLLGGFEQVDYNRNLENIFDKLETMSIKSVRDVWLKGTYVERFANVILSHLYQYKTLQTKTDNVNNDIEIFRERVNFLLNYCDKLNELIDPQSPDVQTLKDIVIKLKKLETKISNITSVNIGGKFEWVDSLFVKTMEEGSWLLLDNVNLMSPAILDRLNSLFEPDSFLSVPERGKFSYIKPHQNFKVFFTMDPKYGDISRAMRNRGVEIFLPRPDDLNTDLSKTMNYMDLIGLLASTGLPSEYHDVCIKAHEKMSSFIQGLDRPTISHLLQASRLTWQQIVRGISMYTAVINSFTDVYIKPRCGGDFATNVNMSLAEMKNQMMKTLENFLDDVEITRPRDTSHTLTVKGLCLNSSYEFAKQIAYIACQEFINAEDLSKCQQHVLFSMLIAYMKCPKELHDMTNEIIKKRLLKINNEKFAIVTKYNEKILQFLNKRDITEGASMRFHAERDPLTDDELKSSNKSMLLLYNKLAKIFPETNVKKKCFSTRDYSYAVLTGNMTDDFEEYPILKQCFPYLKLIDAYIKKTISKAEDSLDDSATCKILQSLNWRNRLLKLSSEAIFKVTETKKKHVLREDIVPLLYIHSKWVHKYLLEELFYLSRHSNDIANFDNAVKNLELNSNEANSQTVKVSKKLRKLYGQPKSYANGQEFDLCSARTNIYSKLTLNMNQPIKKQLNVLLRNANIETHISFALDVPNGETLVLVQENITELNEMPKEVMPAGLGIRLLPITSYIIQRVLKMLQANFFTVINGIGKDDITITEDSDIVTYVVYLAKHTKGFPPAFLNLLQIVQKIQAKDSEVLSQRISSVSSKFWDEFYKFLVDSPALYPMPFLTISSLESEEVEDLPVNSKRVSDNLPLLPYYVQKLTVIENEQDSRHLLAYERISLEERSEYSIQLGTILNILWKNIATLDTAANCKLQSDAEFEIQKYELLMQFLGAAIEPSKESQNVSIDAVIFKLHRYLKDDSVINMLLKTPVYKQLKNSQNDKIKTRLLTSHLSLLTSLLSVVFLVEINPVDHVEKYRLKLQYVEEDIKIFDALLSAYYFCGLVVGSVTNSEPILKPSQAPIEEFGVKKVKDNLNRLHPHYGHLLELKQATADRVHKYSLGDTFRPLEPSYNSFVKDCKHFAKSVLSEQAMIRITTNLIDICYKLYEHLNANITDNSLAENTRTTMKETASWLYSVNAFYKKLESTYSDAFPDLAKPLQTAISQIVYSVSSLRDLMMEMSQKIEQGVVLSKAVTDLMVYPNVIKVRSDKEEHLNRFLHSEFVALLNRNVLANDDFNVAEQQFIEVLKMNLLELRMHCTAVDRVDKMSADSMVTMLNAIVKAWELQQQEIEKKKQDDEALYVTKSKCEDEDEEAIAYEEILEMFPSYSELDFGDFKPPTLEQKILKPKLDQRNKPKQFISSEDVSLVYKWHSSFVRNMTEAEWLPSRKKLVGNDIISAFLQRYPVFSRIIQNAWDALDAELEGTISPSLLVLVSQIKKNVDGEDSNSNKADFYHSPWISETKQCLPLLHRVKESTNELLDQWPDFPTLKEIIVIVNRILSFPVTSPISRFLTGLELLRDKIEEWNRNAHKGNNLIDISLAVGQQIINWRKLEMGHWKECLSNLYYRKQSEAHKYWFYLYAVVNTYLDTKSTDTVPADRVISVLRDFMEKSNLAEYEVRLDIIYVYHCHLVHLEPSARRDELLAILWNTYNYYSQFSAQVAAQIKEKRAPIEKKLRDFVKICTWDRDLSYWSVKDTVEKAHKALHKHTKEFENVLKESVSSCLVDSTSEVSSDHVGIWDRPKRATAAAPAGGAYMIDPQNHVVLPRNIKKYLDQAEQPSEYITDGSLLSKVPSLLNKAKTLCKDTITNTAYPSLVQELDDFVTLVIETSTHLGTLEVDAALPKEKQKSQAKNIVQQKRKALADLFKYLSKLGLNYRTGLVILSASEKELYDFTLPPVDLGAVIEYLKSRRCDATLALLWTGCETYFQKNITRHRLLTAALQSPHQDLGMQNIERCKGFAAQLLTLTNKQKRSISKYSRLLSDLRIVATNLTNALDIDTEVTNLPTLKQKIDILIECYANTSILLEQFSMVLKSCPEKGLGADFEPDFDCVLSDSKIVRCYKNSDEWHDLNKTVKSLIANVTKHKTSLQKIAYTTPKRIGQNIGELPLASQSHIDVTNECIENLGKLIKDVDVVLEDYQLRLKSQLCEYVPQHPILRSITELSHYLKDTVNQLEELNKNVDIPMESITSNQLINQTEDLIATMLLIIQSVYKRHLPMNENIEVINAINEIIQSQDKPEESKDILEDKHLKERLNDKLSSDSKMLQLDSLINKTYNVLVNYVEYLAKGSKDMEKVKNVVMRTIPILEQIVLFVQYFISQKVAVHRVSCKMLSVLLKIFSDLATKGFCKPSDLDMEEGEGEGGPGKLSGGTGLGEGEGQKDVSERIENQDQLDDAHRPGEEKKEEDRDCKEEEKGVNMTDDFDSHLQDVEKKEGDESDKEDDEDDADKQMGDTDNAAERLDQQIWGSEDEEDIEENGEGQKDKEEKGKGESTGEKELGAKEEEQGTDDGTEGKDKKKKKDINEMNEPEVDDDHVDPYHGNQQQLPEPEDFEMPDNMNIDGEEGVDDNEGETETENPFDIEVMKENIPEEPEDKENDKGEEKEDNKHGMEVSSDEEGGDDGKDDKNEGPDVVENKEEDKEPDEEEKDEEGDGEIENEADGKIENEADVQETPEDTENPDNPEVPDKEDLQKNPEKINEEDEVEEKHQEANPQANPSTNDPTAEDKAENAEMDRGTDDNVDTNAEQMKDEDAAPFEQSQEQVGEEKRSVGRSELDKSDKGHKGDKQVANKTERSQEERKQHENKPGQTDHERTLGDVNEKKNKQMKTLNVEREEENADDGGDADDNVEKEADAFQHVKQAKNDDLQAVDAATKEQADQQPVLQDEEDEAEKLKEDEEVPMDVDNDEFEIEKSEELKSEKMKEGTQKEKEKSGNQNEAGEEPTGETGVEVEGEKVETSLVPRGTDTTYHTRLDATQMPTEDMSMEEYVSIREWLSRGGGHDAGAGAAAWRALWRACGGAARALCERLRLVLEPTGRSRMAGDFRSGRAINMRRVIPYIASHFRKDRIWLRRTKPAKREYKIAIAMDDSSSMSDNRSKELAFESLALVSQALNLLESGDLAVISFGEKPNLLHSFSEQFSEHSGSKILEQLSFKQTKTKIAQLLDFCSVLFDEHTLRSDALNAKLLIVVSDGRGIFSEGETRVVHAVRRARQQGIFLVYVIIDNPDNRDSIMDIRRPIIDPLSSSLLRLEPYLDSFPFPFYLILRDMSALPTVLGDALRQWFELAANTTG